MRASWTLLAVFASCVQSNVRECAGGFLCPPTQVCAPGQQLCVLPEQVSSCAGKNDGDMCSYPGAPVGTCERGVCNPVVSLCGNGVIDPGEICDGAPPPGASCLDYGYDAGHLGCSVACGPSFEDCRRIGWIPMRSTVPNRLVTVWGSGPSDVYAGEQTTFGANGQVIHFDGTTWSAQVGGSPPSDGIDSIWGSGPSDVWIDGIMSGLFHFDGTTWSQERNAGQFRIWGRGRDDVYIHGAGGVLHFDGQAFTSVYGDSSVGDLAGTSGGDLFVISGRTSVVHYDGSNWVSSPVEPLGHQLYGVWAAGAADAYAAGDDGVFHFDGQSWSLADGVGAVHVWGSAGDDVFTVGAAGVRHYDGSRWSQLAPSGGSALWSIFGTSARDIFAVGDGGAILHYQGSTWRAGATGAITAMWGNSPSDLYAVGTGAVMHFDGSTWSTVLQVPALPFAAIWGSGPDDIYAAASYGSGGGPPCGPPLPTCHGLLYHFDGSTWTDIGNMAPLGFSSLWGSGPHDIYGLNGMGTVVHYDGSSWQGVGGALNNESGAIWGSGPNDVFVAQGMSVSHFDGQSWTGQELTSNYSVRFTAIWGSGPRDVYVAGSNLLYHYDGTSYMQIPTSGDALTAIGGAAADDVFVAGLNGTLLHYDGTSWSRVRYASNSNLAAVWAAGSSVWFGGDSGTTELVRTVLPGP